MILGNRWWLVVDNVVGKSSCLMRVLGLVAQLRKLLMTRLLVLLCLVHAPYGLVVATVHIDDILEVREDILIELLYTTMAARKVRGILLLSSHVLTINVATIINLLLLLFLGIAVANAEDRKAWGADLL